MASAVNATAPAPTITAKRSSLPYGTTFGRALVTIAAAPQAAAA